MIILMLGFQVVDRFWLKVIMNQKLTLNRSLYPAKSVQHIFAIKEIEWLSK